MSEERVTRIKELWKKMHGRKLPCFEWKNHDYTEYFYNEKEDVIECEGVKISIDVPTEKLNSNVLFKTICQLELMVFDYYKEKHNIDIGLQIYI